jgi:hypothetical protein
MDGEQSDLKQYADRLEFACRSQMNRIAELEAEVERLRTVAGAHGVLKAIYGDSNQPTGHRIKSAAAALPFEVPKLMPERAPLELQAEPEKVSLFDLAEARRKKSLELEGRDIRVEPNGQVILLPRNGGNGSDD